MIPIRITLTHAIDRRLVLPPILVDFPFITTGKVNNWIELKILSNYIFFIDIWNIIYRAGYYGFPISVY